MFIRIIDDPALKCGVGNQESKGELMTFAFPLRSL